MTDFAVYGNIITEEYVRDAVQQHLLTWGPAYIREVALQMGMPLVPPMFASYDTVDEGVTTWPDDMLPAAVIVVGGLSGKPQNRGGKYDVGWTVGIGTVASGQDNIGARRLIACYTAAVRAAILQHPSLGGKASGLEFLDESYNDLHDNSSRTLRGGRVIFNFFVDGITDVNAGPTVPPAIDQDAPPWHTADTVTVTTNRKA